MGGTLNNTIFVYQHKKTLEIRVEYIDKAKSLEEDPDWFHNATIEPRAYLECVLKKHPCVMRDLHDRLND